MSRSLEMLVKDRFSVENCAQVEPKKEGELVVSYVTFSEKFRGHETNRYPLLPKD
ncbi:MAG: hypothetical protein N2558_03645 [Patescibacteria group bacterium]|nr:hypothetical protein [Patescibacteria group bacterium]